MRAEKIKGFTLLEILITAGLFSVIAVLTGLFFIRICSIYFSRKDDIIKIQDMTGNFERLVSGISNCQKVIEINNNSIRIWKEDRNSNNIPDPDEILSCGFENQVLHIEDGSRIFSADYIDKFNIFYDFPVPDTKHVILSITTKKLAQKNALELYTSLKLNNGYYNKTTLE